MIQIKIDLTGPVGDLQLARLNERENWRKVCEGFMWESFLLDLYPSGETFYISTVWTAALPNLYSMAAIHFKLVVKFSYFSIICQQESS